MSRAFTMASRAADRKHRLSAWNRAIRPRSVCQRRLVLADFGIESNVELLERRVLVENSHPVEPTPKPDGAASAQRLHRQYSTGVPGHG